MGKEWTVKLSEIIDYIVDLKRQRIQTKDQYKRVQDHLKTNCNSIVVAMSVIHLTDEGTMPVDWEKRILYSNLRSYGRSFTKSNGTDIKTVTPDGGTGIKPSSEAGSEGLTQEGEFHIDDALKHIELQGSSLLQVV